MPLEDVRPIVKLILDKQPEYAMLYNYYEGEHVIKFSTDKLQKAFGEMGISFAQNWCAVVIDSMLERLSLTGYGVEGDKESAELLDQFFKKFYLGLIADDVHEAVLVTGESFIIMGKVDDVIEAYFNDPSFCEIVYEPANPRKKRYAGKLYYDETGGMHHLILYYPERIERWVASQKKNQLMVNLNWVPSADKPVVDNPYGEIPVFHYRNSVQGRKRVDLGKSERSIQDAVNIIFSNLMVASEYYSLRQRIIISQADPGDLKNRPGENWWVPGSEGGQNTDVKELGESDFNNFLMAMDKLSNAMGATTRTPRHYFFSASGQDPSGEALITMESSLVKKTERRLSNYSVIWAEVAAFYLKLLGREIDITQIIPLWEEVATVQPLMEAQIVKTEKESTLPLVTSLRRRGWTQSQLEQMKKDQADEKKEQRTGLAQEALDALRRADAQSNDEEDTDGEE